MDDNARENEIIWRCIKNPEAPQETVMALRQLGNRAFDVIVGILKDLALPDKHRVYALRRLLDLTKEASQSRNEEVLEILRNTVTHSSVHVRSAATSMLIGLTGVLESYPRLVKSPRYMPGASPSLRAQMKEVVRIAFERGLESPHDETAKWFLQEGDWGGQ